VKNVVAVSAVLVAGLVCAVFVGMASRAPAPAYALSSGVAVSSTASPTPTPTPTRTPPAPLKVLTVSPGRNATGVSFAHTISLHFSSAVATSTPEPRLSPKVPGKWKLSGASTLVFTPSGHLPVYTTVRLTIPAGSAGVHAVDGGRLTTPYTSQFTVAGPTSILRLQQLLAELGYLPRRFHPASQKGSASALSLEPSNPDLIALQPVNGSFTWRYGGIPSTLSALWKKGQYTPLIRGAVMTFESGHGLASDGTVGRKVWTAVLAAVAAHKAHAGHYDYLEVSSTEPQTLSVWQDGKVIYKSLANLGIPESPTAKGSFPVYARYRSVTMSGTNPDGSHYNDPGVPYVAYFNGGDAVHGFRRASYGSAQSLGCVELPFSAAAVVFKYDPIGTLVTVS
jgi:peptidoglycan hydrolase-like protein with peptidoglycan-binding domain